MQWIPASWLNMVSWETMDMGRMVLWSRKGAFVSPQWPVLPARGHSRSLLLFLWWSLHSLRHCALVRVILGCWAKSSGILPKTWRERWLLSVTSRRPLKEMECGMCLTVSLPGWWHSNLNSVDGKPRAHSSRDSCARHLLPSESQKNFWGFHISHQITFSSFFNLILKDRKLYSAYFFNFNGDAIHSVWINVFEYLDEWETLEDYCLK